MTNVIRDARKDFLDGIEYGDIHIVNQRNRATIRLLDLAQEGDELAGVFRGDFDIAQHDLGQFVHGTHEMRTVTFASPIQMQDVTAP